MPDGGRPTAMRSVPVGRGPLRHDMPAIDEAALAAARNADQLIAAARDAEARRWVDYFEPLAERLRDDEPRDLRQAALRARAAYGPKDSVRDALSGEVTEPFLESIDRLIKQLNRRDYG
jgi:hypothetical protein